MNTSTIKLSIINRWFCAGPECESDTFHIDWRGLHPVAVCTKCGERQELR